MQAEQLTYQSFPVAGYTLLRSDAGLLLTFDHGPLGMPPLYNHGHADALSITLSLNGRAMLVDPGTYRYNNVPDFRRYFKGTRAHNTVTVDGQDQAVQETSFIWSRPFNAALTRISETSEGIILEGCHDGYGRLTELVEHRRTILFFGGRHFLIRDYFSGTGIHNFELNYHLHPEAAVREADGWWVVESGGETVFVRLLTRGNFNLIIGQEDPPFGWFSPAYGIKLKTGVLTCRKMGEAGNTEFLTAISAGSPASAQELAEKAAFR